MPRLSVRTVSLRLVVVGWIGVSIGVSIGGIPGGQSPQTAIAQAPDAPLASGELIAGGGADDFLSVRHVVLRGPWSEIGRSLAALASEHGWKPRLADNPVPVRAQRAWLVNNYPAHVARMRGVAAFAGMRLDEDRAWLSTLSYGFARPGCSVVFFPPALTESGQGMLSRNYDFTTGTFTGRQPTDAEIACTSRPYLLELHPTDGHASLSMCAYDLLGGVIDGINSQGLTVALMADDEIVERGLSKPAPGPQPGLDVLQVGRILLDTCASVEDAERLLRQIDLYYSSIPCHYLVADRFGRSFVWENDVSMDKGHAIWGEPDEALVATNFMLHLHANGDSLLAEPHPAGSFNRYRRVREQIARSEGKLDDAEIRAVASCVAASHPAPPEPWAPGRTLWHAVYIPSERSMSVDFYLGEETDATTGAPRVRRSGYKEFALKAE